ncbi:J domain-containing protein [Pannus brasiliensis CCIBt3594]|uniref:J domain-containing protein n=1 Tax=Pannus brasiliensis CCIBt3594 TaxID=1427578 RepID=A0AAW9QTN6_9CHRO
MSSGLVSRRSPEDEELERKKLELSGLETELVQKELDLTTLTAELNTFEREYTRIIGSRYAELERIEEQITEYMAYLETSRDFRPSDSLKKLYREVAKRIHPDLVTDEAEKARRQQLMVEANQAYESGDEEKLQAILQNWESSPESVQGEGIAAELIRVIRKISQCRQRLSEIEKEILLLEETDLYQLRNRIISARELGQDLLADMARHLDEQISEAQQRLNELKAKMEL